MQLTEAMPPIDKQPMKLQPVSDNFLRQSLLFFSS